MNRKTAVVMLFMVAGAVAWRYRVCTERPRIEIEIRKRSDPERPFTVAGQTCGCGPLLQPTSGSFEFGLSRDGAPAGLTTVEGGALVSVRGRLVAQSAIVSINVTRNGRTVRTSDTRHPLP